MATPDEMTALFARGFYGGGLTMGKSDWAAQGHFSQNFIVNYAYPLGNANALTDKPFSRVVKYICVKDKRVLDFSY